LKLYVGNFKYRTTETELNDLFFQNGFDVSVRIFYDQFTRQSRCFGYVEMANRRDGMKAICRLHGRTFNRKALVVREAERI
jgi:RNA recognition motif-containing protein